MLLRFGVENHGSLQTYQELLFTATSLKGREVGLISVGEPGQASLAHKRKPLRVAPVVAIYGANASGKSTVLSAFDFMVYAIVSSHRGSSSSEGTPHQPFMLDENSREAPSSYDVDILIDSTRYHYGFSLDGKRIKREWLYAYSAGSSRQVRTTLFHRDSTEEDEFHFGKALKGENRQISKLVRPNSLFISAAAQNSHPQLSVIYDFFFKKIARRMGSEDDSMRIEEQLQTYFEDDPVRRMAALNFLRAADVGISGIDFSKVPVSGKSRAIVEELEQLLNRHFEGEKLDLNKKSERIRVQFMHRGAAGKDYPIRLHKESGGTQSLLQLLGPALTRLAEGGVLVVDELNSTLHPLVSRELIKLFSHPDTNPAGAQLIFTTHDTNLLCGGFLRRDQIWFTEKSDSGATSLYPLSEIKVRESDNIEAGYLAGRFGAIPFFGANVQDDILHGTENDPSRVLL